MKSVNHGPIHSSSNGLSNLPPYSQIRNEENYQNSNPGYNRYNSYHNNQQRYPPPINPISNIGYQNWNNNQLPRYQSQPYNKSSMYGSNTGFGQYNNSFQNPNMGRNPMMNQNIKRNPMFGSNQGYIGPNVVNQNSNNPLNYDLNNQTNQRGNNMG